VPLSSHLADYIPRGIPVHDDASLSRSFPFPLLFLSSSYPTRSVFSRDEFGKVDVDERSLVWKNSLMYVIYVRRKIDAI